MLQRCLAAAGDIEIIRRIFQCATQDNDTLCFSVGFDAAVHRQKQFVGLLQGLDSPIGGGTVIGIVAVDAVQVDHRGLHLVIGRGIHRNSRHQQRYAQQRKDQLAHFSFHVCFLTFQSSKFDIVWTDLYAYATIIYQIYQIRIRVCDRKCA